MPVHPIPEDFRAKIGAMVKTLDDTSAQTDEFVKVNPNQVAVAKMKIRNAIGALEDIQQDLVRRERAARAEEEQPPNPPGGFSEVPYDSSPTEPAAPKPVPTNTSPEPEDFATETRAELLGRFTEDELAEIDGSGVDGYVTKSDLVKAADARRSARQAEAE